MKTATYTIRGLAPLLVHNERLANPFDDLTRQIKSISGKRKKTEDDLTEMARLEFLGGLYFDDETGIHVPGNNVFAALLGGGKIHKLGVAIKRSTMVVEDKVALVFDGPTSPAALFADKRFVDMRSVRVGMAKVMRCRPIFPRWQLSFSLAYDGTGVQLDDLDRCLRDAGMMVGLCEYRPRFGRFEVVEAQ